MWLVKVEIISKLYCEVKRNPLRLDEYCKIGRKLGKYWEFDDDYKLLEHSLLIKIKKVLYQYVMYI